jgi:hypothetical protein
MDESIMQRDNERARVVEGRLTDRTGLCGTSAPRRRLVTGWHTDDGYSHAVTAAGFTEGVRRAHGQFETVCGLFICGAALVVSCDPHCLRPRRHAPPTTRQARLGRHAYGACA